MLIFEGMILNLEQIRAIIFAFVHSETGWGNPLYPYSEYEELSIEKMEELSDGSLIVTFSYEFDEDAFSQYDKTHILKGRLKISSSGELLERFLEEAHTGVAAHRYYESRFLNDDSE